MNEAKMLIDSLQQYKEACKDMKDKKSMGIFINDITVMQSIAMITEELSNKVTPVRIGIYTSLSLMHLTPETVDKLVADYALAAIIAKLNC